MIFSDGFPSLQIDIHPAFVQSFNDAVQFYIAGDWKTAKRLLEVTLRFNIRSYVGSNIRCDYKPVLFSLYFIILLYRIHKR